MKIKHALRLSFLAIFVMLFLQSCDEDKSSFGEDFEVLIVPTDLSYPEILNAREFSYIETAVPFVNANGHLVFFELVNIKKDGVILDESYTSSVTMKEFTVIEKTHPDTGDVIKINDVSENGKIVIHEGNPFGNGEYFFTVKASVVMDGAWESAIFEDVLRLTVGPQLVEGISYCPFKMNFVSGESTTSNPAEIFGGNSDIRFELGTESDKLTIDPSSGVISINPSYSVSETEYLTPVINIVSNVSEEIVGFENTFTAVLSTTPVALEKEKDYFFFPSLRQTSKQNAALGGDGYDRVFVEHKTGDLHIKAGDPDETSNWFVSKALWRNHKNSPVVDTPDAIEVREEAGVTGTQTLEHQMWTITGPSESWIVMDPQNLALFEGCFDSKAVFWYKIFMTPNSGYEEDGSTPIDLEVKITDNYTGNVTTTNWTQVNDILECEINDNGILMTGTPYPGDQSGIQPPNGVKDPNNSPNDLWVRAELNLDQYRSQDKFTIAFRFKTQYEKEPFYVDPATGQHVLNGKVLLSNVHFVASEK